MTTLYKIYEAISYSKAKPISPTSIYKRVADALLLARKAPINALGRPKKKSLSPTPTVSKKPMVTKPIAGVKYDETHHWPEFEEERNRCRICSMVTSVKCANAKCICAFKRIGIVSSNSIIKKIRFH